jgi:hypothetical protein
VLLEHVFPVATIRSLIADIKAIANRRVDLPANLAIAAPGLSIAGLSIAGLSIAGLSID